MKRINLERWCDRRHQWLFLLSFDLDHVDEEQLEHHSEQLLRMSDHRSKTARFVAVGEHQGLLYWNEQEGWHEPRSTYVGA